jgi:hypothetical protein
VHFYSNFWSFKRSNRGAMTRFRASRRRTAPRHDVTCRARGAYAASASGSASHARLSKAVSGLPNAPRPETPRAPRRPVRAALWTIGPSAIRPVARTPEAPPSVLQSRVGAHVTYKGATAPLPCAPSRLQLLCSACSPPSEASTAHPGPRRNRAPGGRHRPLPPQGPAGAASAPTQDGDRA